MTSTILASISSPSQGVWHIGFIPIRAYALCIITGIIAALVIGDRRWVARGGEKGVIYDIALWAVPFGLIGGRLYHVLTDWPTYFGEDGAGIIGALRIWDGGLGIWGAVALGGVGAWIGCRVRGIPLPAFADAIAPGIILAQAIGRLGNYFNQELYGRETSMPWGLIIYDRENADGQRDMLNGVSTGVPLFENPVHPTFLYELLWNLLVFAVLLWADRRFRLGHGRLFALYVAGYCLGRFWIELMRSDYATLIAGIRVNTFTSTFVFIGAVIYIMAAKKGREEPESLRGKDFDHAGDAGADSPDAGSDGAAAGASAVAVAVAATPEGESAAVDEPDPDAAEPEPEAEPQAGEAAVAEADDLTEAVEDVSDDDVVAAQEVADAVADAPADSAGLGAVDDEEIVEAQVVAPEVHEAAAEAADEAEALADEVAADTEATNGTEDAEDTEDTEDVTADEAAADEPAAATAEGLGAVEGDEVADAVDEASDVHEAAVDAADEAETVADEVDAEDVPISEAEPERATSEPPAAPTEPRKSWWRRNS